MTGAPQFVLVLALLFATFVATFGSADRSENSISLPLSRSSVPVSRVFSQVRRPWVRRLVSANASGKLSRIESPTLGRATGATDVESDKEIQFSWPVRLVHVSEDVASQQLPEETLFGGTTSIGEYYASLAFGGQRVNVQIDTGSSTLAIPLKECSNCRAHDHRFSLRTAMGTASLIGCGSPACKKDSCDELPVCTTCSVDRRACCSHIAPTACGFYLGYADGSGASGALVQADVTIAGLTVPLLFGGVLQETTGFENKLVDGIFGLAYSRLACNPSCVLPLFDTLVESGKVQRDVFAICTGREGGTLTLGGSNPDQYDGELQYVPMAPHSERLFYDVNINGLLVDGENLKLSEFSMGIVDSGTTVLVVTPHAYNDLKEFFQSNYCDVPGLCTQTSSRAQVNGTETLQFTKEEELQSGRTTVSEEVNDAPSWFSPGYCATLTEEHVAKLPSITIVLDGVNLTVDPEVYMLKYERTVQNPWQRTVFRCLGITPLIGLQNMENNAIIGDTVLQNYYYEIDREQSRIGFAKSKNCARSGVSPPANGSLELNTLPRTVFYGLIVVIIGCWMAIIAMCVGGSAKRQQYTPIAG